MLSGRRCIDEHVLAVRSEGAQLTDAEGEATR